MSSIRHQPAAESTLARGGAKPPTGRSPDTRLSGVRVPLYTAHDVLLWVYFYPIRILSAFVHRDVLYRLGKIAELVAQVHLRRWKRMVAQRMLAAHSGITKDRAPHIVSRLVSNSVYHRLDDLILSRPGFHRVLFCTGIEGFDHLERAQSAGKGVLLLSGHFLATRLARRYLAHHGHPMLAVRNPAPNFRLAGRLSRRAVRPRLAELLHEVIGEEVFIDDPGCALKIFQKLRAGGLANIHFDGRAGGRPVEWPLMGIPRRFASGVFDIVRLSDCAVVPMLCVGRSTGFRILFSPMLDIVKAPTRDAFVAANLAAFVRSLEKQIIEYPDEWPLWDQS